MKAKLVLTSAGGHGSRIELDGTDVTSGVRGVQLDSAVGEVTRLILDVVLHQGVDVEGEMVVDVPAKTRRILQLVGWIPPADEEGSR